MSNHHSVMTTRTSIDELGGTIDAGDPRHGVRAVGIFNCQGQNYQGLAIKCHNIPVIGWQIAGFLLSSVSWA